MALRSFRGAASNSTVAFTGQAFNRELLDTGAANGTNGSSVVLAAGASASFYITSATSVPNLTTALTGSWEAAIQFQTVAPTNVFCKFRVHRISVSGTTPTILASTEYSAEIQARAINTPYIANTDGTDLGTFSSAHRIAIEWTLRNAGGASITPQPSFGTFSRYVRTPIQSSAVVGWTGFVGQAAYRPISYSEGTIRGVKRTGFVRNSITSSGTATGTKGGSDFSGSVTGISTSSGTIAAGRQGYTGAATGASTSSGTVAAGTQGYSGSSTGSSTSTGSANGTPGPTPEPPTGGAIFYDWNRVYDQKKPEPQLVAFAGRTMLTASYSFATVRGVAGFTGLTDGTTATAGSGYGGLGYYGAVQQLQLRVKHRAMGKARLDVRGNKELLLLIGEL
jgi:hypothetical protein